MVAETSACPVQIVEFATSFFYPAFYMHGLQLFVDPRNVSSQTGGAIGYPWQGKGSTSVILMLMLLT